MKKQLLHGLFIISFFVNAHAQSLEVFPPNWYTGMEDSSLQLIVHGKNISTQSHAVSVSSTGIQIQSAQPGNHPDYLILNCTIQQSQQPGMVSFRFGKSKVLNYELKAKQARPQTLTGNDLIYLIMPDRFANGNTSNDIVKTMRETTLDRNAPFARHGGDLKGVEQKLPYLDSLGATTLWLTPFLENNEPTQSYHGYAITDHYRVDPRLGDMNQLRALRKQMHDRKMKWVLDLVFNHIGDGHWLYRDKPIANAFHKWDSFTRTQYRANTLMDPYASKADQKVFTEGWFDHHMPDLNLDDPILATYMVQHTLWWIEESQADGIRLDTYAYPEQAFMQSWYRKVKREYPSLSIFAEIWEHAVPLQSYFVPASNEPLEGMQNVLDFQFCFTIDDAVSKPNGWTDGINKLYYTLSQDYLYRNPYGHVIFADNHDLDRFFGVIGKNLKQWKAAMAIMLTTRGIPSVFYGTEILMSKTGNDGVRREDFWGGWPTDSLNKFSPSGRTNMEQEAWQYLQQLAQWRKAQPALSGKLMQFIPEQGVYVYFRYTDQQRVMVLFNSEPTTKTVALKRYAEMLEGKQQLVNPFTGQSQPIGPSLSIEGGSVLILEVK